MTANYDPTFECNVSYDAEVPCVIMTWKGYATSPEFRDANERVLGEFKARNGSKMLCDVTNFVLIGSDDQRWLYEDWIPRAMAAGMRTCALVMPVFYFNRVAIENVVQRLDRQTLAVQHFSDREAARAWLVSA